MVAFERYYSDREDCVSLVRIDSQSIKLDLFINLAKGYDGNKKVNERKRHVLVDTLGLVLGVLSVEPTVVTVKKVVYYWTKQNQLF